MILITIISSWIFYANSKIRTSRNIFHQDRFKFPYFLLNSRIESYRVVKFHLASTNIPSLTPNCTRGSAVDIFNSFNSTTSTTSFTPPQPPQACIMIGILASKYLTPIILVFIFLLFLHHLVYTKNVYLQSSSSSVWGWSEEWIRRLKTYYALQTECVLERYSVFEKIDSRYKKKFSKLNSITT